jgi:phospholipase C
VLPANGTFAINFINTGDVGAWFHVRTSNGSVAGGSTGPWGYTVEAGKSIADTWTPQGGAYDLSVHGPNGFFRRFAGRIGGGAANLVAHTVYDNVGGGISLRVTNAGSSRTTVTVADGVPGVTGRNP